MRVPGTALDDRSRRELRLCVAAAVLLVLMRSVTSVLWERTFDSDQAIVGLMAKHLSEFRAFPLFFYGQNYMLGVQSWIAVPFFWIGGPTVAMVRLPLVLINAGVAAAFIVLFTRLGLRPILAFIATLPFIVTSPAISDALLETLGASVEPFAYVLVLWMLRHRPVWFGAVFCVGYLHREFVLFVASAILVVQWVERKRWTAVQTALAAAAFFTVWGVVDLLKRTINVYGPPGGEHAATSLLVQSQQILAWLSMQPEPYLARVSEAVRHALPDMFGARGHHLSEYGVIGSVAVGSPVAGAALGAALVVCAARVVASWGLRQERSRYEPFPLYLALIGIQTLLAYGLNSGINPGLPPILRYLLFALLLPIALLGAFFRRERRRSLQVVVAGLVCLWAGFTVADNVRLVREFVVSPPPNPHRELADYLTEHRIRHGRAGYWDAYIVTFLARERVILASTEKVRISAYQARVDQNESNAVVVRRQPCSVGKPAGAWCVEDPFNR
jgi:hypothetical protein